MLEIEIPHEADTQHVRLGQAEASSVRTFWFVRENNGKGGIPHTAVRRPSDGATLLHIAKTEAALLLLHAPPWDPTPVPAGVVYAGLYFGEPVDLNDTLPSIHHPRADRQKLNRGQVTDYLSCTWPSNQLIECGLIPTSTRNSIVATSTPDPGKVALHLCVEWAQGISEKGSEGAALWWQHPDTRKYHVAGQLLNKPVSLCSSILGTRNGGLHGRFDLTFKELRQWLDPDGIFPP